LSAGQPGAGVPSLGSYEDQATSDRSGATLRALLTNPPQEIPDVKAEGEQAEIPEAEAYANVGASTSLPDLAVGAAAGQPLA